MGSALPWNFNQACLKVGWNTVVLGLVGIHRFKSYSILHKIQFTLCYQKAVFLGNVSICELVLTKL